MRIISRIITNIIASLYQYLGISIVSAFLFMFFYKRVTERWNQDHIIKIEKIF